MYTDPIADLLTRIRNGYLAKKLEVPLPHSKTKEVIAQLLKKHKFVVDVKVKSENKLKILTIYLKYENNHPALEHIQRMSRPNRRLYLKTYQLKKIRGGLGIGIISTPKGIMTTAEAKKKHLGGELICEVW